MLVSALIVTLIAGAVAGALMTNIKATGDQHRRTQAQALAEQDQERLKGLSSEQLDNLNQSYTTTQDKYKFTVSSQAYYLNSTSGASCSASGGAGATYFKTISTVSWTNAAGVAQTLATDESVITPPAGGSILAQFHDQTTAPLSGVSVAANGPESDAASSDGNGCTIFTGLDTGAYNLTFTDNGYVDPNGNASPLTDTTTVASTGIASPSKGNPIEMGLGGGITANFSINGLSPTVLFPAPALSWYGSGGGYSMSNYRTNDPNRCEHVDCDHHGGWSVPRWLVPVRFAEPDQLHEQLPGVGGDVPAGGAAGGHRRGHGHAGPAHTRDGGHGAGGRRHGHVQATERHSDPGCPGRREVHVHQ